jgi:hypothetical protein
MTLISVINQTRTPDKIILYDDSKNRADLRTHQIYQYVFQLMASKKIEWEVLFGQQRGQHIGHQLIQASARELVWRIDDDEIAEPNVLEILEKHLQNPEVGAAAGVVILPLTPRMDWPPNTLENINNGNCQWYRWEGVKEVEHLYSSYLYRKGVQDFDINLSPKAFREETLHTYGILKKGLKLVVDGSAVTYHFQSSKGGIRSEDEDERARQMFLHDEIAFQEILREYDGHKICFLDCGMGDHLVFKSILPKIKEKYKDVTLAVCYPELFPEEKCISIAEGAKICNPDRHNIFKWCIDHDWKDREIKYAYAQMYGVEI